MSDDLPRLLAEGERAAFHGAPGAAADVLDRAVTLAEQQGRTAELVAASWLLGVALGAGGRYGAAFTVLGGVLAVGAPQAAPESRLFAGLAAGTLASLHRQIGRHAPAWELDQQGLVVGGEHPEVAFDCRLGLAADAVGLGDLATAQAEATAAAGVAAGRVDWWRQRVRLDWVRAEIALLAGQPTEAAAAAAAAVRGAETARAPRHVAKGLLFQGVAEVQTGAAAAGTLRRAATLAEGLGALPLVWPARAVLGALVEESDPDESGRCLAAARSAVLTIAADLPEPLRTEWLARPDVAALLTT